MDHDTTSQDDFEGEVIVDLSTINIPFNVRLDPIRLNHYVMT